MLSPLDELGAATDLAIGPLEAQSRDFEPASWDCRSTHSPAPAGTPTATYAVARDRTAVNHALVLGGAADDCDLDLAAPAGVTARRMAPANDTSPEAPTLRVNESAKQFGRARRALVTRRNGNARRARVVLLVIVYSPNNQIQPLQTADPECQLAASSQVTHISVKTCRHQYSSR